MTKADYLSGIANVIEQFDAEPNELLDRSKQTALTDAIAAYCETVNPTNDYPPTPR